MSLDATVYCDCYERGKLRTPPPQPEFVFVEESGGLSLDCDHPDVDQDAFNNWRATACEHGPWGELVSHRLGNITLIEFLRSLLATEPARFPILLAKVLYNGVHGGDFLSSADVDLVSIEVDRLKEVHAAQASDEPFVRNFERQMRELVQAAQSVGKPIAF